MSATIFSSVSGQTRVRLWLPAAPYNFRFPQVHERWERARSNPDSLQQHPLQHVYAEREMGAHMPVWEKQVRIRSHLGKMRSRPCIYSQLIIFNH